MKKIVIHRPGNYEQLKIEDHPTPIPGDNEVLIKVKFIGVNYADVLIRWGVYQSAKDYVGWPITPGFEVSGVIEHVGKNVINFKTGDPVFAVTRFGGYTTHLVSSADQVFHLPKNLSMEAAAGFPAVYLTAYHALFQNIVIPKKAKILIHSAAGGVGSALLQLCRFQNYETTGVVGSSHKVSVAKSLGANFVIDKSTSDLWKEAEKICPAGYDVVLDANGAETLKQSYEHLAPCGKLLCYGFHSMFKKSGGNLDYLKLIWTFLKTPRFNPLHMTGENKSVIAFNLSYLFDKKELFNEGINHLVELIEQEKIRGPEVTIFDFTKVADAHRTLESGQSTGKIVLRVPES